MMGICSMCRKYVDELHSHHAVPRFLAGDDGDVVQVCLSCHTKAEAKTLKLIIDPFNVSVPWRDAKKQYIRQKQRATHIKAKTVFSFTPDAGTYLSTVLRYDAVSGTIHVFDTRRNGHCRYLTYEKDRRGR